ncbi:MAG: hypothetical protein R3F17_04810 [Planctomycetota bacterium]
MHEIRKQEWKRSPWSGAALESMAMHAFGWPAAVPFPEEIRPLRARVGLRPGLLFALLACLLGPTLWLLGRRAS